MPFFRPRVNGGDVTTTAHGDTPFSAKKRDDAATAMTKWIPVEVIACYQALAAALGNSIYVWLPYAIPAGMIVTFGWIAFATEQKKGKSTAQSKSPSAEEYSQRSIAWRQSIVSTIAFGFWAAGSTSADAWIDIAPWWNSGFNPLLFAIGGVLLPICDGMLRHFGVPQD